MKFTLTFLIITFVVFGFSVKAQHPFNASFERLDQNKNPIGWDLTYANQNKYDIQLDSLIKVKGKYSVSITSNPSAQSSAISYTFNKKYSGRRLILIGHLKTENVTDGFAGLWIRVDGAEDQLAFEMMENQGLKGTNDWKEYMIEVPYIESSAESINIGALLFGKGKIWVDSLRLYLDEVPIDKVPESTYSRMNDTTFSRSSKIDTILPTAAHIKHLTLLGEVWGFIKYHHPAIAAGKQDWDAALFKVMPLVLKAHTDQEVSKVLEEWIDGLGEVPLCKNCDINYPADVIAERPNYGSLFTNNVFSKLLKDKLQYILNNSNNEKHFNINFYGGSWPKLEGEKEYSYMQYPDVGYRLLALYRYWNVIQYFSPNRNLIKEDWNKVLPLTIPELIKAQNKDEYTKALVKLVSTIHDTHGFMSGKVYEAHLGKYKLPFQAKYRENKLVVTGYYNDTLNVKQNLKVGDIILAVNGEKIDKLIKKYLPYTSASNFETAMRDMPGQYLLRDNAEFFNLEISRDGENRLVTQQALPNAKVNAYNYEYGAIKSSEGHRLLTNDIGYVVCNGFRKEDMESIKQKFGNTKGIIVDMRSYPIDKMHNSLGDYFKSDSSAFVKFTSGSLQHPGLFIYEPLSYSGTRTDNNYKGKVMVLVNEMTQSNAEMVTMAFQSAKNVKVVGSTTAGADGNISSLVLPGGFHTSFSGIGVYYPDGTNAQRKGVKIDYVVRPTINGIKNGVDEVLEKAKALILEE